MVGSRKVIAGFVLLGVGLLITIKYGDIPQHLLDLMQSLYLYFVAANGVEHASKAYVTTKQKVQTDA